MPTPQAIKGLSSPGDYSYPQYSRTYTRKLSSGLEVKKGLLYTTNGDGEIVAPAQTLTKSGGAPNQGDFVNWRRGVFQALDDITQSDSTPTAQFMGRGSRIIVPAETGVTVGDLVGMGYKTTNTGTANQYAITNQVATVGAGSGGSYAGGRGIQNTIGTVIEVRSGDTIPDTYETADGDLVVVEVGGY